MKFSCNIRRPFLNIKRRLLDNSFDGLLWLVNAVPSFAGFSVTDDKISVRFWLLHWTLMVYVYAVGNLDYLIEYTEDPIDYIKSYVNTSLSFQIANISYWFINKRSLLKATVNAIKISDDLAKKSKLFSEKHIKLLTVTKRIIMAYFTITNVNGFITYVPARIRLTDDFAKIPCVGISLDANLNRAFCTCLLIIQEITIIIVAMDYQVVLLFLISHTTAMYTLLAEEMMALNDINVKNVNIHGRLTYLVVRHIRALDVVDKLKTLYSSPLGVHFASNALCIALFFSLPVDEWINFMSIMIYCLQVLFLYCFLCQRLVNASEAFERAVYGCGWENFGVKDQKLVYIMLIQAQNKVEILAGDIIPVNMYTFAVTLQWMYKFVTVMKF